MKLFSVGSLLGVLCVCALSTGAAHAQLAANQTAGFGKNRVLTFTYEQNFVCLDQPTDDLDFNGVLMQSDPAEFQTPICQVATEPTIDPTGKKIKHTAHLYVLVPMFSVDNDQNPDDALPCPKGVRADTLCGPELGNTLISIFGVASPKDAAKRKGPGRQSSSAWRMRRRASA